MNYRAAFSLAVVGLVALLSGCGDSKVETHAAKGTLKIKGMEKIPSGITLTLIPTEGASADYTVTAPVESDGSFVFGTHEPGDGAPEGKYKVVVNVKAMSSERPKDASPQSMMEWQQNQMAGMKAVDAKYKDAATTTLPVIEITSDEAKNTFTFELDENSNPNAGMPAGVSGS